MLSSVLFLTVIGGVCLSRARYKLPSGDSPETMHASVGCRAEDQ